VESCFDTDVLGGVHYSRSRIATITLTSRTSVTLTRMRVHYVVGVTVYFASHCCLMCVRSAELCIVIVLIRFSQRVLQMSDSTAAAAFHRKNIKKSKCIPSIFNDESTGLCICLRQDLYMSHVNKV
jgi:hypothetical protein